MLPPSFVGFFISQFTHSLPSLIEANLMKFILWRYALWFISYLILEPAMLIVVTVKGALAHEAYSYFENFFL